MWGYHETSISIRQDYNQNNEAQTVVTLYTKDAVVGIRITECQSSVHPVLHS